MSLRTIRPESESEGKPKIIRAKWLATMVKPVISDGAVIIHAGRFLDVGSWDEVKGRNNSVGGFRFDDIDVQDLGQTILLPGLVNAHTHLELSDCVRGEPPTDGFAGWLGGIIQRSRSSPEDMQRSVERSVAIGIEQCQRFGVTTIGDISRQCGITRALLRKSSLQVVSYGEVQAMAQRRGFLEERITAAVDKSSAGPRLRIGITPHAPYSIEPAGYQRCLKIARDNDLPLATHLAETRDEERFLSEHAGPLRELWKAWLTWDEEVPRFAGGPIRFARELGLLDYPTLLAHVNFCDDAELEILANGNASVVYCPRTHAFFGHPPHRWREMIALGINVAVGTDSCASSPDLNLVDDLRLLHEIAPEVPAESLWKLATINAAKAIGMEGQAGTIQVGNSADMVAFEVTSNDGLTVILETSILPSHVWYAAGLH